MAEGADNRERSPSEELSRRLRENPLSPKDVAQQVIAREELRKLRRNLSPQKNDEPGRIAN